jgi:hypothetical protein
VRTSFHHQSEAQPPNGTLTAATSPDTPSYLASHAVGSLWRAYPVHGLSLGCCEAGDWQFSGVGNFRGVAGGVVKFEFVCR